MSEKLKLLKRALGRCWTNEEEHQFHCPKCNHHKLKLSVNIGKDVFKCWVCDYSGTKISPLIRRFAPSYYAEWRHLADEVDLEKYDTIFSGEVQNTQPQAIELPENFQTLTGKKTNLKRRALDYLYSRGVADEDILRWKMGFCNYGDYQGRIIIPGFNSEGELNFFVARSYVNDWMKYKNPKVSKDIIFNDLNIDWSRSVILVEGAFDAIRCENAIPLLGSTLRETSRLFQKICEKKPNIYIALDADAKEKQLKIAKKLLEYGLSVYSVDIAPHRDVAETPKEILKSSIQNAAIVSSLDYLNYKLDF